MEIKRICVVGAGTMGHGIAELLALYGYDVTLADINEDILQKAIGKIKWSLNEIEKKKGLTELVEYVLGKIKTTVDIEELGGRCDYVIEAVPEDIDIKKKVFSILDNSCNDSCILASNTSTIPITEIAEATRRLEKVIGLHFSNPPLIIPAVEIILSKYTSKDVLETTKKLVESIGKKHILVKKDLPGFIVNRINLRVFSEAIKLVEEGVDYKLIDAAFMHRLGFPMGLFEVLDLIGIDVVFKVIKEMRKRGFIVEQPYILEKFISENKLGLKSGEGFYKYKAPNKYSRPKLYSTDDIYRLDLLRILSPGVNEAMYLLEENVASAEDIDNAMEMIMSYPKGILSYADEFGLDTIYNKLNKMYNSLGKEYYKSGKYLKSLVEKGFYGVKTGRGIYTWKFEEASFGPVNYFKLNDYAVVKMNRPEKLNALNEDMWRGLEKAFAKADEDKDIRVIILTGEGKAFSAGDDISVMGSWISIMDGRRFFDEYAKPFIEKMLFIEKPIIMAVNGIAFGGGMEIALLGDIIVSRRDSEFSVPEALIGAFPPIASSLGFALYGRKILRYACTGERISPEEAKKLGFVDIVVEKELFWPVIIEFVDKLRRSSPLGVKAVKRTSNMIKRSFQEYMSVSVDELTILSASEDFEEGMKAFKEKRKPVWSGK